MLSGIDSLRKLYEERRLGEARAEYMRLWHEGKADAEAHLLGALVARLEGSYQSARIAIERAEMAGAVGDLLGKIRLTAGNIMRELGDTHAAIAYYQAYIDGLDEYPETRPVCLGAAYYGLGLVYRDRRQYDLSLSAYERACEEFRRFEFPNYLRMTLQNIAWACCHAGDTERATECLDEAEALCASDVARWQQELVRALLEMVTGNQDGALRRCAAITGHGDALPPALVSHACWIVGKIAVVREQFDMAELVNATGMDYAIKAKDSRVMNDANALRQEIATARAQQQAGR